MSEANSQSADGGEHFALNCKMLSPHNNSYQEIVNSIDVKH